MLFVTAQQDDIHHFWHLFLLCHHWTQIAQTIQFEWVVEKEKVIFLSDPNQKHASIQSTLQWIFKSTQNKCWRFGVLEASSSFQAALLNAQSGSNFGNLTSH